MATAFKVGQKVRVLDSYPKRDDCSANPRVGKTGIVRYTLGGFSVGVEFEDFEHGHGLDGTASKPTSGWNIEKEYVQVIEESTATPKSLFPTDAKERKDIPLASGVLDYFPSALIEVAKVSFEGNKQHNPGQPLHWARGKSMDQSDTTIRHFMERGTFDTDGIRHSAKLAWRALAILQLELEAEGAPVARGAKV
jgi:Domain of unknown function (DUF5664)